MSLEKSKINMIVFGCWVVGMISMLGSLFFSEIMQYPPCALCWYQRIAMYPLVIILGIGLFQPPKLSFLYSMPFAVLGFIVALYHNLLHYGIVPESASPCRSGIPCSTVYVNFFGFLTIPMLSLIAFSIICISLLYLKKGLKYEG